MGRSNSSYGSVVILMITQGFIVFMFVVPYALYLLPFYILFLAYAYYIVIYQKGIEKEIPNLFYKLNINDDRNT